MPAAGAEAFQVRSDESPVPIDQLCTKCRKAFGVIWGDEGTADHLLHVLYPLEYIYNNIGGIVCRLCAHFASNIKHRGMVDHRSTPHVQVNRFYHRPQTGQIMLVWRDCERKNRTSVLYIERGGYLPKIAANRDCDLTWSRIRHWMAICYSTSDDEQPVHAGWRRPIHVECHRSMPAEQLPTRLIHVSDDNSNLRLCETADLKSEIQALEYTTLTHCWGSRVLPTRTLSTNLQERLEGITFEELDKTFRDAIIITRRLGYRFLWIDSLCIVQDSVSDWDAELAKMGNIFAGCALNIIAADAEDASEGCLFDGDSISDLDLGFSIIQPELLPTTGRPVIWTCIKQMSKLDCVTSTRAWCFQETYLSPRSIYFNRGQLVWECRCMRGQETQPYKMHLSGAILHGARWNSSPMFRHRNSRDANFMVDWTALVEQYSNGQLTYWKDKLPALSGIARSFREEFIAPIVRDRATDTQDYLAGMWNWKLEQQLFWFTNGPIKPRLGQLSAPSWSWASVDSQVRFSSFWMDSEVNFRIIRAQVTLSTVDPFGIALGGLLILECNPLIAATLKLTNVSRPRVKVSGIALGVHRIHLDEPLSSLEVFLLVGAADSTVASLCRKWVLLLQKTVDENIFRRVGCLQILKEAWDSHEGMRKLLHFQRIGNKVVVSII